MSSFRSPSCEWKSVASPINGMTGACRPKFSTAFVLLLMTLFSGRQIALGQCAPELIVKFDSVGGSSDWVGSAVAIDGDTAVVAAWLDDVGGIVDAGSAHVLVQSNTTWAWQATLTAAGAVNFTRFGQSVDVDGETIVVGTQRDTVYVFTRSGSTWTQQAILTAPDAGTGGGAAFGMSVTIDGDTLAVGASSDANTAGAVYVFVRSGTVWSFQQKLSASDPEIVALMGISVDLEGDTLVAGAPGALSMAGTTGAAYVFTRTDSTWMEAQKLVPSTTSDDFGHDVAISDETMIIGAPGDSQAAGGAGAAFFFDRGGTTWTQTAKRTPNESIVSGDNYGFSVAIYGDTAIVGAYRDEADNWGSAWLHVRDGGNWMLGLKISPGDPGNNDEFGVSVGISRDVALVGSHRDDVLTAPDHGSGYFYDIRCDGACCVNGACTRMSIGDCNTIGGVFQGLATNCTGVMCAPSCCIGDMNGDRAIDGLDVQDFVGLVLEGVVCP